MKNALIATLLLASTAMADTSTERKSIFKLAKQGGHGTGFIVEGNLLLTAIHVADEWGDTGKVGSITAKLIHREPMDKNAKLNSATKDGVAVYKLNGGPFRSLKVADGPADLGSTCKLMGYPKNAFSVMEAEMIRGDDKCYNIFDAEAVPGNSGGPLLNRDGEVVGLVTHAMPGKSLIVGTNVLKRAVAAGLKLQNRKLSPGLVIFGADFCPPCQANKRAIKNLARVSTSGGWVYTGTYNGTPVTIVENIDGVWSDPSYVARFTQETSKSVDAFPTYWVPTSGQSKVGGLVGDVINWAVGTLKGIVSKLIGDRYVRNENAPELDANEAGPEPVGPESDLGTPAPPAELSVAEKLKKHAEELAREQIGILKDAMDEKLEKKLGEQKADMIKESLAVALKAKQDGEDSRNIILATLASLVAAWGGKQTFVKRFAAKRIVAKIESLKKDAA